LYTNEPDNNLNTTGPIPSLYIFVCEVTLARWNGSSYSTYLVNLPFACPFYVRKQGTKLYENPLNSYIRPAYTASQTPIVCLQDYWNIAKDQQSEIKQAKFDAIRGTTCTRTMGLEKPYFYHRLAQFSNSLNGIYSSLTDLTNEMITDLGPYLTIGTHLYPDEFNFETPETGESTVGLIYPRLSEDLFVDSTSTTEVTPAGRGINIFANPMNWTYGKDTTSPAVSYTKGFYIDTNKKMTVKCYKRDPACLTWDETNRGRVDFLYTVPFRVPTRI